MKAGFRFWLVCGLLVVGGTRSLADDVAPAAILETPASLPAPGQIDEAVFREGLRARGLTDWLTQYEADTPPVDEIDALLRQREALIAQLDEPALSLTERAKIVTDASAILQELIETHSDHPARLAWLLDRARDDLLRTEPTAFESWLRYELPGRDRATVARLSGRARLSLERLRQELERTWSTVEGLDESALDELAATNVLSRTEAIDRESVVLLAWAKLYHLATAELEPTERAAGLTALLWEATDRYGWTREDNADAGLRCRMLTLAAVTARYLGRFDEAGGFARQMIAAFSALREPGQRAALNELALVAVLEQIRALADAGKRDEALKAIETAQQWVGQSRPDDLAAALAANLAEWRVMAGSADRFPGSAEALVPLELFAVRSPAHREALYAAVAGAMADQPVEPGVSPFELQLMAGGAIHDCLTRVPSVQRSGDPRLGQVIEGLTRFLGDPSAELADACRGELIFLTGRVLALAGKPLEAAAVLADLPEKLPGHDRAGVAVRQAVALAGDLLAERGGKDLAASRAEFIRAVRLMRTLLPDDPNSKALQYSLAVTLEQSSRWVEAVKAYAVVPADDPRAMLAGLRRLVCVHRLLDHPSSVDIDKLKPLAIAAVTAGRAWLDREPPVDTRDPCLTARLRVACAEVLNHPDLDRSDETVEVLADVERRFANCPAELGQALRQRVLALRRLKRLAEARQVVGAYLKTDPEQAGPVMAKLLEAMRQEIETATDRGEADRVATLSNEAAELAASLLSWADEHPDRVSAGDRLTIGLWRIRALLDGGQAARALAECERRVGEAGDLLDQYPALGIELDLARAEGLRLSGQPAEALPIFTRIWNATREESQPWWRAFVGSLECHTALKNDPVQILQSIRQRRHLSPGLGGPGWKRRLEAVEKANAANQSGS